MEKTKTLLIGCGGSGITTLLRLNGLLACKADFRKDMRECIYYLVLDTDLGDLKKFRETINSQMGGKTGVGKPYVMEVPLTENCHSVASMLNSSFDQKDGEICDLLKKYWWYNKKNEPFRGIHIDDPTAGAAQCCQVSYLAAWNAMSGLDEAIPRLLNEIKNRNKGANPLENLKVFIVAGLAGGTGRGSWPLVAFKIRQSLDKHGIDVPIDGIFFDGTCYPTVNEDRNNENKFNLFVNSLTGLSELSAWIRLKNGQYQGNAEPPFPLPFSLPFIDNPKSDHSNDSIKFNPATFTGRTFPSPVNNAYVVFGDNGEAPLADNEQYHNMAAAALYTQIVDADKFKRWKVNERFDIGSFASTTFEVDFVAIQTYLQTAVKREFLEKQYSHEDDTALSQEAMFSVGPNVKELNDSSFLGDKHLWIDTPVINQTFSSLDFANTEQKSLLQVMMESLSNIQGSNLKVTTQTKVDPKTKAQTVVTEMSYVGLLRGLLEKCPPKKPAIQTVLSWVKDALALQGEAARSLNKQKIEECFNNHLKTVGLDEQNRKKTLCDWVMKQFAPQQGKKVSLRRAMLFTEKLCEALQGYMKTLTEPIMLDGKPYSSAEEISKVFVASVEAKSTREWLEHLGGRPFNPAEIRDLCKSFPRYLHAAVFFRVRDLLNAFYQKAVDDLNKISGQLESMAKYFARSKQILENDLKEPFSDFFSGDGGDASFNYEMIFDLLFADGSKKRAVLAAIPPRDALENLFYRQLKPIVSRKELSALLTAMDSQTGEPVAYWVNEDAIINCVETELRNLLENQYRTSNEENIQIPEHICNAVRSYVGLKEGFMELNFTFDKVLTKNIESWNNLLAKETNRDELYDRFRDFLGLDETKDYEANENGEKVVILQDTVKKRMVSSLVKVCKPWIKLRGQSKLPSYCLVVLPFSISKSQETELKQDIRVGYDLDPNDKWEPVLVYAGGSNAPKSIPLNRILVYTCDGLAKGKYDKDADKEALRKNNADGAKLENILSLEYWEKHREMLELAEEPDGSAMFFDDGGERARTFAFLAPFFVMEPFRELRWHPWLKEEPRNLENEQFESVCAALFYAFLGHNMPDPVLEALQQKYGWGNPLLEMGKTGKAKTKTESFTFCHKQLEWQNGKMAEIRNSAWKSPSVLATSIDQVVEYLNGEGLRNLRANAGADLEQSRKKGAAIRCAILQEAEAFYQNIPDIIGKEQLRQILNACCDWIAEKEESCKDSNDRKYWKALSEYAENELKKRG